MLINAKGQVTIPAEIRERLGWRPGDVVEVVQDGDEIRIAAAVPVASLGERLAAHMRGKATAKHGMSTDELMTLSRDDD